MNFDRLASRADERFSSFLHTNPSQPKVHAPGPRGEGGQARGRAPGGRGRGEPGERRGDEVPDDGLRREAVHRGDPLRCHEPRHKK